MTMIYYQNIRNFLNQESLAVIGVSRSGKKFGNTIFKALKVKGYTTYAINPFTKIIDGMACFHTLADLPEKVGGIVLAVPPAIGIGVLHEANKLGIRHVWLQQGAESQETIQYCQKNGINVIYGECILMFAEPVNSVHRVHRIIRRMLGKIPRSTNGAHPPIRTQQP